MAEINTILNYLNSPRQLLPHHHWGALRASKRLKNDILLQLHSDLNKNIETTYAVENHIPSKKITKLYSSISHQVVKRGLRPLDNQCAPSFFNIPITKPLTPTDRQITSLVFHLTEGHWVFSIFHVKRAIRKFGLNLLKSSELLKRIEAIKNGRLRQRAEKHFIRYNMKMAGLQFGFAGEIRFKRGVELFRKSTIPFEGYFKELIRAKMATSLSQFFEGEGREYLNSKLHHTLIEAYTKSTQIDDLGFSTDAKPLFQDWKDGKPVILPTGWPGHAVEIILYKGYLIYANRGASSMKDRDPVEIYKISHPEKVTASLIKKLTFSNDPKARFFLERGLKKKLGLVLTHSLKMKGQYVGNCAWASPKAGFYGLLSLILKVENKCFTWDDASKFARTIYKLWGKEHRLSERDFISQLLISRNKTGAYFTPKEEWKFWGELLKKFCAKKYDKKIDSQFISRCIQPKKFKISDMVTPLNKIKRDKFVETLFENINLPGACLLAKTDDNRLVFHYKNGANFKIQQELIFQSKGKYILNGTNIVVQNLEDLQKALHLSYTPLYPVASHYHYSKRKRWDKVKEK